MQTSTIKKIRKRDGRIVDYNKEKIVNAIYKAILATGGRDRSLAERLADKVQANLEALYPPDTTPSVEDVQDIVEQVLIEEGLAKTAKAYILYRQERRRIREEKKKILQKELLDEVDKAFDTNSLRVLASRYLLRDGKGRIIESPKQLFQRVATLVGVVDLLYDPRVFEPQGGVSEESLGEREEELQKYLEELDRYDGLFKIGEYSLNRWHFEALVRAYIHLRRQGQAKIPLRHLLELLGQGEFDSYAERIKEYYDLMVSRDFMPNSPTLMNAGARLGQLSACFVLDISDDLESIMKAATDAAMIFKSGGGVGINYSKLRPMGDMVASTSGVASGPVSFMKIIDVVTDVVKQGGKRRGANMGILEVWHPDIESFITAKQKPGVFENFNISVGMWEDFWAALSNKESNEYALINPRTRKPVRTVDARQLFELIAFSAWKSAEPGVIYFDRINKYNVLKPCKGLMRATNPCGEQPLYSYESCNLGSINLANFVVEGPDGKATFDWERFEKVVRLAVRFLDNIIDANKFPIPEIEDNTRATRKIGLGIMGLADLLFKLRIPYNSEAGYHLMDAIAEALAYISMDESVNLAAERGAFPLYEESEYPDGKIPVAGYYEVPKEEHRHHWDRLIERIKTHGIRNAMTTTIAPSGSISMIADTSNGVEPIFGLVYEKHVTVGKFYYVDKVFEQALKEHGLYDDELLSRIAANRGSLRGIEEVPRELREAFVTALDIHWADHLMAQAVWQRWISAAISKTINMPRESTVEDVKNAYILARELGLKGVTIYRDGSRQAQVMYVTSEAAQLPPPEPSDYVKEYVKRNITTPYARRQLKSIFDLEEEVEGGPRIKIYPRAEVVEEAEQLKAQLVKQGKEAGDREACPVCGGRIVYEAGCNRCVECGWSECVTS
jgi:ribonucleoside-diphosphate reductase alpha chain